MPEIFNGRANRSLGRDVSLVIRHNHPIGVDVVVILGPFLQHYPSRIDADDVIIPVPVIVLLVVNLGDLSRLIAFDLDEVLVDFLRFLERARSG